VYIVENCILTTNQDLLALHSALDVTLDNTRSREGIIPQDDLTILYEGVWLDKELSRLHGGNNRLRKGLQHSYEITHSFLPQNHVTDLPVPAGKRGRQLYIELARTSSICCALPDLQIDKEFTDNFLSMREHFLAVDLARA
jgi:hypothetical protein